MIENINKGEQELNALIKKSKFSYEKKRKREKRGKRALEFPKTVNHR